MHPRVARMHNLHGVDILRNCICVRAYFRSMILSVLHVGGGTKKIRSSKKKQARHIQHFLLKRVCACLLFDMPRTLQQKLLSVYFKKNVSLHAVGVQYGGDRPSFGRGRESSGPGGAPAGDRPRFGGRGGAPPTAP